MSPNLIVLAILLAIVIFAAGAILGASSTWRALRSRRRLADEQCITANLVLRNPERWQPVAALVKWYHDNPKARSVHIGTESEGEWKISIGHYADGTSRSARANGVLVDAAERALSEIRKGIG